MIKGRVVKVFSKAMRRYAKEYECENIDIQVLLSITNEGLINYEVCKKFKPKKLVTFNDLLDVSIDLLSREALATPFLQNSFVNTAKDLEVSELNELKFIVYPKNKEADKFGLYVFVNNVAKKEISFDGIFDTETMLN